VPGCVSPWPGISTHHICKFRRSDEACNLIRLCQTCHDRAELKRVRVSGSRAAVAIVRAVRANQAKWAKLGFDGMKIGVGLNTGDAVVGAVGSPQRLDYSAIGDTTNTAARVEAENKHHGTEILISERTLLAIPAAQRASLGMDELAPITPAGLKGKSESIYLFAVDPNLSAPAGRGG